MQAVRVRVALGALGAGLGIYAIALESWKPGAVTLPIAVHVAVGWSFVAAGLVAAARRPDSRLGLLMMLTGAVWFGRDFDWFDSSFAHHASELSQNLFLALIAHQVIVFPSGVARSRAERTLVGAAYVLAVGGYGPSEASDSVNTVLSAVAIALAAAILYLVVDRWIHAAAPARRALQPVVYVGPPVLAVVAVSIARDYIGIDLSSGADTALDWSELVYTAIPLAFLAGVLRTRLRRAVLARLVVELAAAPSPAEVRDALARALGDPSLEIALRLGEERYVDLEGRPLSLARGDGRLAVLLEHSGEGAAVLYDPAALDDPELVEAAGAAAMLALRNTRLRTAEPAPASVDSGRALPVLTPREREVLALMAEGRTDRGIASALYVTPKTVEAHVRSIFRKLDLPSASTENRRVHAVLTFLGARAPEHERGGS